MNELTQTNSLKASKAAAQSQRLRKQLWPNLKDEDVWLAKRNQGFSQIPRLMPLVHLAMDELSGRGKPVSSTYFALWCRNWGDGLIKVDSPMTLAAESGFGGQRAVTTWSERMRLLKALGFIQTHPGSAGEFSLVQILHPFRVLARYDRDSKLSAEIKGALLARASEVGADEVAVAFAKAAGEANSALKLKRLKKAILGKPSRKSTTEGEATSAF